MMYTVWRYIAGVIVNCNPSNTNPNTNRDCQTALPTVTASPDTIRVGLQFLFGIVATVTVIYIIVSAIRYQVSVGNPEATAKIRNTIIYAAVGLVIALSAEAIVTFTIGRL